MPNPIRVFVYRCPDPKGPSFAVRELASGNVIEREEVWLADAVFEVSPSGRHRSLSEQRRTVHAGVFGTLLKTPPRRPSCEVIVRYRPSESPFFVDDERRPVHDAPLVHLIKGKTYIAREDHWL
jgi:hypothetical protein